MVGSGLLCILLLIFLFVNISFIKSQLECDESIVSSSNKTSGTKTVNSAVVNYKVRDLRNKKRSQGSYVHQTYEKLHNSQQFFVIINHITSILN